MQKKNKLSVILAIALLMSIMITSTALAATYGGSWEAGASITYSIEGIGNMGGYESAVATGANMWNNVFNNNTIYPPNIYLVSMWQKVNVYVYDYGPTSWLVEAGPLPKATGTYTGGLMNINKAKCDSFGLTELNVVAGHEWGHILGLAHVTDNSLNSIMLEAFNTIFYTKGIRVPQQLDINHIKSLYT